jgi:hypothetical protein
MVDEATSMYILEARKCFDDLRLVAAQIAGVLVLAEAGGKSATPDHPMLKAAAELHREAVDQVRGQRPSAAAGAHHELLSQAADSLAIALAAATGLALKTNAMLPPVREAYGYLERASNALPGFPMVAFEQGCCAVHVHS